MRVTVLVCVCVRACVRACLLVCVMQQQANTPTKRLLLAMRSNAVAWNPREPMYFTAANEDHNLYVRFSSLFSGNLSAQDFSAQL